MKIKEMTSKIKFFVLGIAFCFLVLYFLALAIPIGDEEIMSVNAGQCFDVFFDDTDEIVITNLLPISDYGGMYIRPVSVILQNNCLINVNYQIDLDISSKSTVSEMFLKTSINDNSPTILSDLPERNVNDRDVKTSYELYGGNLGPTEKIEVDVRVWVLEEVLEEELLNLIFDSKVLVLLK